jgi:hypothetical protein
MIVELAKTIISEDENNKVNNTPKNALSCTRYQGGNPLVPAIV